MSTSQELKDKGSSANPLSTISAGTSSSALAPNPTAPHSKTRRSGQGHGQENKHNKQPSFLSILFCCGASSYVHDPTELHVGPSGTGGPTRPGPAPVSLGKAAGKKTSGHSDEKSLPVQPIHTDLPTPVSPVDEASVEHPRSIEITRPGLLGPIAPELVGRKCLVLDLDETLIHSSFKLIPQADYVVPVEIDNQVHNVYVIKRPGVDTFLQKMGELFEVIIFTASVSKYADPVLDMLDVNRVIKYRLFRESCFNHKGNYVKDLSVIGRDLKNTIIIDNSPACYLFHQTNAIPITTWFNDPHDTELLDLIPFLADMTVVDDVNPILDMGNEEQGQ